MTELQRETFRAVANAHRAGRWYRAAHPGQRVTLASLYRKGVIVRRARRGNDGDADAAYEYAVSVELAAELALPEAAALKPSVSD